MMDMLLEGKTKQTGQLQKRQREGGGIYLICQKHLHKKKRDRKVKDKSVFCKNEHVFVLN